MTDSLDFPAVYELVLNYFGAKLDFATSTPEDRVMTCVLYEAFPFSCGLDEDGAFAAHLTTGFERVVSRPLGTRIFSYNDRESIRRSLALVDKYCRLRLPNKYLRAFARTHWLRS